MKENRHILSRFDGDLGELRRLVLSMGDHARAQVALAARAFSQCDVRLARDVAIRFKSIRNLDMELQETNLRILAMYQPVASDLRYAMTLSRTAYDLERVNAEALRLGEMVEGYEEQHYPDMLCELFDDVERIADPVIDLFGHALHAMAEENIDEAVKIIQHEAQLGSLFQGGMRRLATFIMEDPRNIRWIIDATVAMKSLERVGDHAVNIGKNLIFAVTGKDVRYIKPSHLSEGYLEAG